MLNPQQFRLLLAGPRVARLHPFVVQRGYVCDACTDGETALEHMRAAPRHVLLVELELGDMMLADLLEVVREENLAGAVLLLDDPAKSGLIVSTLTRGIDGYIATPPDEAFLFRVVERQLLAQWALAQAGQMQADVQDKARLEKQLSVERAKVTQLVKDLAGLRDELAQAQVQATTAAASAAASAAAAAAAAAKRPAAPEPARKAPPTSGGKPPVRGAKVDRTDRHPLYDGDGSAEQSLPFASAESDDGTYQPEQRTAPRGYERGEIEALLNDESDTYQTDVRTSPAGMKGPAAAEFDDDAAPGFEDGITTNAGLDMRSPPSPAEASAFEEKSESDLFLDLDAEGDEDASEEPTTARPPPTAPGNLRAVSMGATKPMADPFEDSLDD